MVNLLVTCHSSLVTVLYAQGYVGYTSNVAIDASNPATLYAVTYGGAVFKSTNRGASWTACSPLTSTAIGLNKGRGQLIGGHQA